MVNTSRTGRTGPFPTTAPLTSSPRPRPRPPAPDAQAPVSPARNQDINRAGRFASHASEARQVTFPESTQSITRETLMAAIAADNGPGGLAARLNNPRDRATFERIADLAIRVGQQEGIDPRILFAMAMQESDCGLNTNHGSSAQGITGIKPSSAPDRSARSRLNDPEVALTQTARYLKGQLVRELKARGHNVSAADLAPGVNNDNTAMLLLAYRFGAGGLNQRLRNSSLADLIRHSDYAPVFRHLQDMGLPRT